MDVDIGEFADLIEEVLDDARNIASKNELEMQAKAAVKAFQNSDRDGNGVITLDELAHLCDLMGLPIQADEQDRLLQMDADGSGAISMDEWARWWVKRSSAIPNPGKQQEVIATHTFEKYDADGSGTIDMEELKSLLGDLGSSFGEAELREAMVELDRDGNGTLDKDEFVDWWCNRCIAGRKSSGSLIAMKLKRLAKKASRIFLTDIHTAVWQGDAKLVSAFLKSDSRLASASDTSEHGDNWTALHYACYKGHEAIADELLSHGANVNSTNNEGFTPLFYAAQQGHTDLCAMLVERGGDPTMSGVTAAASTHFFPDLIMCPLEHAADTPALRSVLLEHPKCSSEKVTQISKSVDVADASAAISLAGVISIRGLPTAKDISRDLFVRSWRVTVTQLDEVAKAAEEELYADDDDDELGGGGGGGAPGCRSFDLRIAYSTSYDWVQAPLEITDPSVQATGSSKWVASAVAGQLMVQVQVVTPLDGTSPLPQDMIPVAPPPAPSKKKKQGVDSDAQQGHGVEALPEGAAAAPPGPDVDRLFAGMDKSSAKGGAAEAKDQPADAKKAKGASSGGSSGAKDAGEGGEGKATAPSGARKDAKQRK